jgi:2-aminoadipate transaminase
MNDERRDRLVALARRYGVPIVEDDPYGELAEPRTVPLRARDADSVIYLSSFSKTIAPSLRLGWLIGAAHDLRTAAAAQAVLRHGHFDVHPGRRARLSRIELRRAFGRVAHRTARARVRSRSARSRRWWPAAMRVTPNADGYYVWATTPRERGARALLAAAERLGRIVSVRRGVLRAVAEAITTSGSR